MKNKLAVLLLLFFSISSFCQKDTIIDYFNYNYLPTTIKENVRFVKITSKVNDTLWKVESFYRTGILLDYEYYKSSSKKTPVGESISFHRNGKKKSFMYFNNKGQLHGKLERWFDNGNKDTKGGFIKGKKHGAWKFYHYNGKLAARIIYNKDTLLNSVFFNEKGEKEEVINFNDVSVLMTPYDIIEPAKFKGGMKNYTKKVENLILDSDFDVKGKIIITYIVGVDGKIRDINVDEKIPEKLLSEIRAYLKKIKGWSPATSHNRKIPFGFSQVVNFN